MNRDQQQDFVHQLSSGIARDICEQIKAGKIPEGWDGHELRALLADRHEQSARMSLVKRRRARARDYRNTVLINNLDRP